MMDPKSILLVGVKRSVVAVDKNTGRELWSTLLFSGLLGDGFVSIMADEKKVYAHCKGELYCLDLFNGNILWKNPLTGRGYGLATMAIPGGPQTDLLVLKQKIAQDEANSSSNQGSQPGTV